MCMVQHAQTTAYLNAEQRVSGGRGRRRHKCTLTKGCAAIHDEGYFWLKWHRSGAGSHSHATKDGPDCLKFYANDTCLSEFSRFSTPPGGWRDLECTLHPIVHLSLFLEIMHRYHSWHLQQKHFDKISFCFSAFSFSGCIIHARYNAQFSYPII